MAKAKAAAPLKDAEWTETAHGWQTVYDTGTYGMILLDVWLLSVDSGLYAGLINDIEQPGVARSLTSGDVQTSLLAAAMQWTPP